MKRLICLLIAALMILGACSFGYALPEEESPDVSEAPVNPGALLSRDEDEKDPDPDEIVTLIVKLADAPVAAGVKDISSRGAKDARSLLIKKQERVKDRIASLLPEGCGAEFLFGYQLLFNGFALRAPARIKSDIEKLEGVESVCYSPEYALPETVKEGVDTRLSTSVGLINAEEAWALGYTGKGTTIAIIDSGCVLGHDAFAAAPDSPCMDAPYIDSVLDSSALHAEDMYMGTLSGAGLYYSAKIPFRFNYVNGSLNVADSFSGTDHGTHIAGIAAGSDPDSEYKGVAKDAQLAIMQVYGPNGKSDWATIMAALEDCAYLGVDAVDLSFGIELGYTTEGEGAEQVFSLLAQHGVNVSAAAGDSASSNGQQYYGSSFGYALAMNPDNGIVASPGTYTGSLCIACCEKTAPAMASFSSAGTTSDLKIKPELTAPGVNINAPVDPDCSGETDQYGPKSSSAMSSAHAAGAQAIITQYIDETMPGLSPAAKVSMADRLMMCTANPIPGVSPRLQGSGILDIGKAVTTKAYVTVSGCSRPKLELGDDPGKTGVYTLSFNVVNFGEEPLTFSPQVTVLTPALASRSLNGQSVKYMKGTSTDITSNCTISSPGSITVLEDSVANITVTISLSPEQKAAFDEDCPNGMFVEGFVKLDSDIDLSVPFLGFYGNWNRASVFDRYTFIDEISGTPRLNVHTKRTVVGSYVNGSDYMLFGANPYIESSDWLADRCTLSPNGDGYYDDISRVTAALLRSTASGRLSITAEGDPDTVWYSEQFSNITKSWRYRTGNYSYSWSYASDMMLFKGWSPASLNEGDTAVFELSFELANPGFTADQNECSSIVLPMTVDTKAPVIRSWSLHDGVLDITVHDDHYAAWIGVYSDPECTSLITEQAIAETERGADTELSLGVNGRSTVYVRLGDYGRNTTEVFELFGDGPVALEGASISPAETVLIPGQTAQLQVVLTPSDASCCRVEWSSSAPSLVSVEGSGTSALITGVHRGGAVITARVVDISGNEAIASASVTVQSGYEYDHYVPTDEITADSEYLIGWVSEDGVYLLMNCNPDTIGSTELYYSYENSEYCYGIKAALDRDGFVSGLDDDRYPNAVMENVQWDIIPVSGYYQIRSRTNQSYYLKVASSGAGTGLFPAYGTGNSTKWSWNASASKLSYYALSGTKVVSFAETVGDHSSFFNAPAGGNEYSAITLFRHETGTVTIDDPEVFTVTFVDWDGSVLDVQEVEYGSSAAAPEDPVREGYAFTGWDCDFSFITCDLTVTAQYRLCASLLGDTNCDGRVTMADVSLLLAHVMNAALLSEQGLLNADVNQDGRADILDASPIYFIAFSH